jgi:hypothetical protein
MCCAVVLVRHPVNGIRERTAVTGRFNSCRSKLPLGEFSAYNGRAMPGLLFFGKMGSILYSSRAYDDTIIMCRQNHWDLPKRGKSTNIQPENQ